jgi:acetyltransferase
VISSLLRAKSIAIVGDSPSEKRGGKVHENLIRFGFDGDIYPVNPKYSEIRGNRCFSRVEDIPRPADLVVIALAVDQVGAALDLAAIQGAGAAIIVGGGFREAGAEGTKAEAEIVEIARRHNLAVCGPNCYGVANIAGHMAAYSGDIASPMPEGNIALVSQSGAMTHSITEPAVARGIGFSWLVSSGNESVTGAPQYIRWIAEDPKTEVIGCFLEGISDPSELQAAIRHARKNGKRVAVLRAGKSNAGGSAAKSHTGAVGTDWRMADALLRGLGVAVADDIDEFIEICVLASRGRVPSGQKMFLTISGGLCGLIADLSSSLDFSLAWPEDEVRARTEGKLPGFATLANPLDLTGAAAEDPGITAAIIEELGRVEELGSVVVVLNSPKVAGTWDGYRRLAAMAVEASGRFPSKSWTVVTASSGPYDPDIIERAEGTGVACLMGLRESIVALREVGRIALVPPDDLSVRRLAGNSPVDALMPGSARKASRPGVLREWDTKELLRRASLPVVEGRWVSSVEGALDAAKELGFPVVVKADADGVIHKAAAGAIALDVRDPEALVCAWEAIISRLAATPAAGSVRGMVVERMVTDDGVDLLVSTRWWNGCGPFVTVGLGGVMVEALDEVVISLGTLSEEVVQELASSGSLGRMLRGRDVPALASLVSELSNRSVDWAEDLEVVELNPVRVLKESGGAVVLDALAMLGEPVPSSKRGPL